MRRLSIAACIWFTLLSGLAAQTVIFEDNFESGTPSPDWQLFWDGEDPIQAVDMGIPPIPLADGGAYVGYLQDMDGSYTGAAQAIAGDVTQQNYTVQADVYCYVNNPGGSAYTGVVAYADSSMNYYVKLVADFDNNHRFRLYNNILDMATFSYTFYNEIDATGLYDESDWHNLALEVETLEDGNVSYTAYFDGEYLGGPYIDDADGHTTSGSYGVFSFQQGESGIAGYFDNVMVTTPPEESEILFEDDMESGFPADDWFAFWEEEEELEVFDSGDAPEVLGLGGDYVAFLEDGDVTYNGAAMAVAGNLNAQNYMVEADVYCYTNHPGGSAYTGVVAYADSAANYYVKLVADFDGDNRLRLYNNDLDMETFQYTFHETIDATGLYDGDGWHKLGLAAETLEDGNVAYIVYFDGEEIGGPYVDDAEGHTTSGYYGVFSMQMDADGLPGWFDNIIVTGSAQDEYFYGDMNSDGALDILDIVATVSIIMGQAEATEYQLIVGDMNSDGSIDILDIVNMVSIIMGNTLRADSIDSAEINIQDGRLHIQADGDIAGVQLRVSGDFSLDAGLLPADWYLEYNGRTILLYKLNAGAYTSDLDLWVEGQLQLHDSIIAGWNGSAVSAKMDHEEESIHLSASSNPFNPDVVLEYAMPRTMRVNIAVFDIRGRLVTTLVNGVIAEGTHTLNWQPVNTASGVYFVRMQAGNDIKTLNIALMK